MNAARWKQIDELLDAALDVSEELRANFVAIHAGDDEDLRIQVVQMLAAHTNADKFLNDSAMRIAARDIANNETEISAFAYINKKIATYKVERLLGAGGMGEVYLAFDEKLQRNVALKILPAEFGSNDERLKRFEVEARAVSSLNHPAIVTIFDVGNFGGVNFIATEYVDGKTLRELIGGKYSVRTVVSASIQICDALAEAHRVGIIHRDIKPENIMIRKDGYAKILDFGLAKLTDPETHKAFGVTSKGVIIGTPAYMSPAQITDDVIDHRTDLWSSGIVLYEFLTGKNPFKGGNRSEIFQAILTAEVPPPSTINPEIPEELDTIVQRLLEKDPGLGYQSVVDLRADLKRVRRQIDSSASISVNSRSGSGAMSSHKWTWALPAALVSVSLLLVFAIFFLFFFKLKSVDTDFAAAQNTQITYGAGIEAYPSLSPDGRSVLYVTDAGEGDDIYLLRIGGSNTQNLTKNTPGRDTMPAFSPNGEMIAFRSDRDPAGTYIMGATGENPRRIAEIGYSPSWSPDGKQIVVATGHQPVPSVRTISALWVIDVGTGEKRMLIDSYAMQPAWSPKGDRIAYWTTGSSGNRVVATIPVAGGEPVIFAESSNTNWNPVWSPDGKYLYYASDRNGNMAFWRAKIDMESGKSLGEHKLVPTPARFNRHLTFSGDGKRMAYVQSNSRSNIKMADFDPVSEKFLSEPYWVTRGDFDFAGVELSPDETRLFARSIKKTQDDIVSLDLTGAEIRDLTNDKFFDRHSRISPDGTTILFSSDRSGSYEIWAMNADGTNLRQVTHSAGGIASIPAWAPDGKRFSFDNESTAFIAEIEKEVSLEKAIQLPKTDNGGYFRVWSWSPDGKLLAGTFGSGLAPGMGIYRFETGKYVRITDYFAVPRWMPDGKRLIFERNRRPFVIDLETGAGRELLPELKEEIRSVGVSRSGRKIFYTTYESESDIWLVDLATTN